MGEKPYRTFGPDTKRKRSRSRNKYEWLKKMEIKRGYAIGEVGNHVWLDVEDHSKGFYELDEEGNEIQWYPDPEPARDEKKEDGV